MSLDGVRLGEGWPFLAEPSGPPIRSPSLWQRFRYWRWRWLVLATVAAVSAAASILLTLANNYRPLAYGDTWSRTLAYPGLPAGHGIRTVNTFGNIREDIYVPPQRGSFYLFASVANIGSHAITIEKVSLPKGSGLTQAGAVRYARPGSGKRGLGVPFATHILHDVRLAPNQELLFAIPVRSWPCAPKDSYWSTVSSFYVSYRFLFFHHVAALPWGFNRDMIIMHEPFGKQGQPGIFCVK